jgi:CMP-N-acetylneuraminic acid synthetase
MIIRKISTIAAALVLVIISAATALQCQSNKNTAMSDIEKAIQARLDEIQNAAQALNPDKVFSFVLDNNQGALVQNGKLFLTREQALESTKQGFQGIQKIAYQFDKQHITLLSPTVALAVSEGLTSVTTNEGRTFTRRFAQSVVFVLTNGEWKVFHSHQSAAPA